MNKPRTITALLYEHAYTAAQYECERDAVRKAFLGAHLEALEAGLSSRRQAEMNLILRRLGGEVQP